MFDKNDPLISAVKKVMETNAAERDAEKSVNEKFGIQDRKVLPRERQVEWEAAYKSVLSEGVEATEKGTVPKTPKERLLAKMHGSKKHITHGDVLKARGIFEDETPMTKMGVTKPDYSPKDELPDYAKTKEQTSNRADKTSMPAGTVKKSIKESTLKSILASYKKKNLDEGFNDRHDSSVTASADKQVVADQLNEKVGNPLLLNKAKTETKPKARIGDTGIRRTISGTNDVQTRLANLRNKPTALDTKRDAELDKPGLEKAGVSQALKDPKAREVLAQTTKDAAEFAVPSAMTGGPVGSMIARGVVGAATKGYGLVKNTLTAGKTTATAAKPAVSAAAREGGSAVPKITKGTGQGNRIATPRKSGEGPWGSTKPPEVKPSTRTAPSGTFASNLQRARQSAQSGRVGGSTVGATQQAAKLASRSKLAQSAQSGRVGGSTVGATQQAARLAARQRLSATAKDIRAGAGRVAAGTVNAVKKYPKLAAGAAGGAALGGFAATQLGNKPPETQAGNSTSTVPVPKVKPVKPSKTKKVVQKTDVKSEVPVASKIKADGTKPSISSYAQREAKRKVLSGKEGVGPEANRIRKISGVRLGKTTGTTIRQKNLGEMVTNLIRQKLEERHTFAGAARSANHGKLGELGSRRGDEKQKMDLLRYQQVVSKRLAEEDAQAETKQPKTIKRKKGKPVVFDPETTNLAY